MAVRLRFKRFGRRHRPFFRLCAIDQRSPRDGRALEELGFFDPLKSRDERKIEHLKDDRVKYWLSVGAQPSQTVASLLKRSGIDPVPGKKLDVTSPEAEVSA